MTATDAETVTGPQPIKGWVVLAAPVLGTLIFGALLAVAIVAFVHSSPGTDIDTLRATLARSRYGYFIGLGVGDFFYICLVFAAWLLLPKSGPASLSSYFPAVSRGAILLAIGAGFVMTVAVGPLLGFASQYFHFDYHPTPGEIMLLPKTALQLAAVLFLAAVMAPIGEEILFRGLLLRWLRKRVWLWLAIAVDALLFAVAHGRFVSHIGIEGVIVTAVLMVPGIVLALLAVYTRSLWPGVVAHGTYNGLLLTLAFIAPNLG